MMPWSDFITTPTSYRANLEHVVASTATYKLLNNVDASMQEPDIGHISILVLEAVLEVVCVSLCGFVVARRGGFDADAQKFAANINVNLFTPCLVFTKLASQLTADKLKDLAIIPVIFVLQTSFAIMSARVLSWLMRMNKRQRNFVTAMGVFPNSNSLPISLIMTLSSTLDDLHWDKIPGDNDDEVAARGILYLLVFQQFGQLLRWTWGYNVLLAPADRFTEEEGGTAQTDYIERGRSTVKDEYEAFDNERSPSPALSEDYLSRFEDEATEVNNSPVSRRARSPASLRASSRDRLLDRSDLRATYGDGHIATNNNHDASTSESPGLVSSAKSHVDSIRKHSKTRLSRTSKWVWKHTPRYVRKPLVATIAFVQRFLAGVWAFINPPLAAMLVAIVVASIPKLQHLLFDKGRFLANSVSKALKANASVAVPLNLVVLGGNLARNTASDDVRPAENLGSGMERKMLIACLLARMVLPTLFIAPILAYAAKHVPISILDDKIFIIVCFLLSGSPPALQLAQICQINDVFMSVVGKLLLHSYVVWILPSTLVVVILSILTVTWAES